MLGRALFALVWLIIAAGLLLPLYPADEEAAGLIAAGGVQPAAGIVAASCEGCEPAASVDDCGTSCPCQHPLPAASAAPGACLSSTVYLVVQPLPPGRSGEPRPHPPKLPAI
jgi:hypothetical protein